MTDSPMVELRYFNHDTGKHMVHILSRERANACVDMMSQRTLETARILELTFPATEVDLPPVANSQI